MKERSQDALVPIVQAMRLPLVEVVVVVVVSSSRQIKWLTRQKDVTDHVGSRTEMLPCTSDRG